MLCMHAGGSPAGLRSTVQAGAAGSGNVEGQRLVYSNRCGRIRLNNVTVQNKGVDWDCEDNIYWQHKVCCPSAARNCTAVTFGPYCNSAANCFRALYILI